MKNSHSLLLAAAISLAAGILMGRNVSTDDLSKSPSDNPSQVRSASNTRPKKVSPPHNLLTHTQPRTFTQKTQQLARLSSHLDLWSAYDTQNRSLDSIKEIIRTLSPSEIEAVVQQVHAGDGSYEVKQVMTTLLFQHWARLDGQAATEYAIAHQSELNHRWLESITTRIWAKADPPAAEAWLNDNSNLSSAQCADLRTHIISSIASKDFQLAIEKTTAAPAHESSTLFFKLGEIAAQNEQSAATFMDYLTAKSNESPKVNEADHFIMALLSTYQSEKAIEFIEKWPHSGKERLVGSLLFHGANTEPKKVLDWIYHDKTFKPSKIKKLYASALAQWANNDIPAANQWISDHPNLNQDDLRITSTYSSSLFGNDFPTATKWVSHIQDNTKRIDNYSRIYSRWNKLDPDGAKQWIFSLPKEDQAHFTSPQ